MGRRGAAAMVIAAISIAGCGDDTPERTVDPALAAIAVDSAVNLIVIGCRVEAVHGAGSMVVDDDGNRYVLTAAHVVAGSTSIVVTTAAGGDRAVSGVLVALDPANDLALVSTSLNDIPALPIEPTLLGDGDEGAVVVFREGEPLAESFGIVNRADVGILDIHGTDKVTRSGYRIEVDIEPGDSGAVLVDDAGRAAGVLYARSQTTNGNAFASDASAFADLSDIAAAADPVRGIDPGECATQP